MGALVATVSFSYLSTVNIFYTTAATCVLGFIFSLLFSTDLTHVSLSEHDAQLELFLEGRIDKYKGMLNRVDHLSLFERCMGRHGEYDEDWAAKLVAEEMMAQSGDA